MKGRRGSHNFPVVTAWGKYLFPFRTEQSSPSAPMVLGPQGPGRVGRRRFNLRVSRPFGGGFSCFWGRIRRCGVGRWARHGVPIFKHGRRAVLTLRTDGVASRPNLDGPALLAFRGGAAPPAFTRWWASAHVSRCARQPISRQIGVTGVAGGRSGPGQANCRRLASYDTLECREFAAGRPSSRQRRESATPR